MKLAIVFLCVSIFAHSPSASAQSESPADALDVDESGTVDFPDFLAFADAFGSNDPRFDLDLSGSVDFPDFLAFAQSFNQITRFSPNFGITWRIKLPCTYAIPMPNAPRE